MIYPCTILNKENRFVIRARLGSEVVRVHNTNTGRLEDLIWEGNEAYCEEKEGGKLKYRLIAAKTPFGFAVTDTNLQERVLKVAFEEGAIPWARGCEVKRRPKRRSVFDFELLCEERILIEVKSADLASPRAEGMWPDCPTERGRRHLKELSELEGRRIVLFVVGFPRATAFVPYYRGDPEAYEALLTAAKRGVEFKAIGMYFEPFTYEVKVYGELPVILREGRDLVPQRVLYAKHLNGPLSLTRITASVRI